MRCEWVSERGEKQEQERLLFNKPKKRQESNCRNKSRNSFDYSVFPSSFSLQMFAFEIKIKGLTRERKVEGGECVS